MRVFHSFLAAIFGSILVLSFTSCEQVVDAGGLPYEERLVIHSILFADSATNFVRVSRTLPVNVEFDTAQAFISDAIGSVTDGSSTYPLEYIGYGGKYLIRGLKPSPGVEYKLTLGWHGLKAQASTTVPTGVSIDSLFLVSEETRFEDFREFRVAAITNISSPFSASFEFTASGDRWVTGSSSDQAYDHADAETDGHVYARELLFHSGDNSPLTTLKVRGMFMGPGYKEYYESSGGFNDDFGDPIPVRWNIDGDAIGVFFGCQIIDFVQKVK